MAGEEICLWRTVSVLGFILYTHALTHIQACCTCIMYKFCFFPINLSVLTRFLVHRYSVMREHVEANKIEGVDDIDSHYMETGKAQYNEDSDQVSIESPIFSVTL